MSKTDPTYTRQSPAFDHDVASYDAMINWPKRLANETPFYRELFASVDAKRVLDVACGPGRHAAMFRNWGLRVEGADVSSEMLAYARALHGEPEGLRWVERSFFDATKPPGAFDVAICVGNSLGTLDTPADISRVLRAMVQSVRPGGVIVAQMLNLLRFPEGTMTWQKCVRKRDEQGDRILLKGIRRHGCVGTVDLVEVRLTEDGANLSPRDSRLIGVGAAEMRSAATQAAAGRIELFGDYQREPFNAGKSVDLILVAGRDRRMDGDERGLPKKPRMDADEHRLHWEEQGFRPEGAR
jgi:SAM-dependent methyltransferase